MSSLMSLVKGMPEALHKQYNFEVSHVTGGSQLLHSPFLQVLYAAIMPLFVVLLCISIVCMIIIMS